MKPIPAEGCWFKNKSGRSYSLNDWSHDSAATLFWGKYGSYVMVIESTTKKKFYTLGKDLSESMAQAKKIYHQEKHKF